MSIGSTLCIVDPSAAVGCVFSDGIFLNSSVLDGIGAADDRLDVNGQYLGDGGTFIIDTVLGDDGSATDRVRLNSGTAEGITNLVVNKIGGAGAIAVSDGTIAECSFG